MKNIKSISVLIVTSAVLVLGYQNCGPDAPSSSNNSSAGGAPFGYSASVDRIAYTSCDSTTTSADYFSLRAGTYDTSSSGVQLSSEFRNAYGGLPLNKKIELLNVDEHNQNAQLALALRPFDDLTAATSVNGTPAVKNVLTPLNAAPIVNDLASLTGSQFLPDSKYQLRGSFQFNAGNDQSLRDVLTQRAHVLSLTYLAKGQRYISRVIGNDVPGSAYHLMFNCGLPGVLCGVQEYDMLSGQGAPWDCSPNFQFRIIRQTDSAAAGCNFSNPQTNNPIYVELRKILGTNWQIDVNGRCLLNTGGTCYAASVNAVDYNNGPNCDQQGQPACARYFSLCVRDI